jgi:alcohol dehydrogenase class IV
MKFEFSTAHRIVFGPGAAQQVPDLAAGLGKRVFLVLGSGWREEITALVARIPAGATCQTTRDAEGTGHEPFRVSGEPTVDMAQAAVSAARAAQAEMVIAIGGGSVIDTGKVVAAMLRNEGELPDYLEVVGKGQRLRHEAAPCIAVPTTAGTGAEVTYNAVLAVPAQHVKVSMRSPLMLPRWAVVDPLLTCSMPPALTASTGLDALTQLIEAFVSRRANPLTDGICREGLQRAGQSLRRAFENGDDLQAREDMSLASLLSGMALANAGLGAVHGFAGPLGGMTGGPHGVICGKLLPYVMQANVRATRSRRIDSPALARFDEVGRILTGTSAADASDAVSWIEELCALFSLPGLRRYGLRESDFSAAVEKARKASSMKGNPLELHEDELRQILRQAID